MPLFGKKKEKGGLSDKEKHKRYQDNLWEAENSPGKQVDLSNCGLKALSGQAVAAIKLNKEALLLHNNTLSALPASLGAATYLRVLDLHNNHIKELPSDLRHLVHLQVLNLENNALREFPSCCLGMVRLETLNLARNKLKALPDEIGQAGQMIRLRTLSLEHNAITHLPTAMHRLRVLDTLSLAGNPLKFPEVDTTKATTTDVMKALCAHAGAEYVPPSQHVLDILNKQAAESERSNVDDLLEQRRREQEHIERLLTSQDKREEDRAHEQAELRRRQAEEDARRDAILKINQQQKRALAEEIAQRENEDATRMVELQEQARRERLALLEKLSTEDSELDELARRAIEEWHRKRNDPALRQQMLEAEDDINERFIAVSLAKQASREAAIAALHEHDEQQIKIARDADLEMEQAKTLALEQLRHHQAKLDSAMHQFVRDVEETRHAQGDALKEEERQRYLLLTGAAQETDARRQARLAEIEDLNRKLESLALHNDAVKFEKQERRVQELAVQREEMEKRLQILKKQEAEKEAEQMHTLLELEDADRRNYRAYWEAKLKYAMEHLGKDPVPCDPVVKSLLSSIGLLHLAPKFAESHVDAVVLRILTDEDLASMGIKALGDRKKILHAASDLFKQQ
ncbi:hypothetical protein PTSG_12424 [Salpingoeca rosetta]|uniref:SAM domain-containing protein n=1 Tax=Salpingoeca rosetta (strain ATCC 50818 / BSB-021) TaxID=946362 RepID=F2UCH3_SALR5|nr:uncharacterized protein PTSG_12424 [Salpingoeca rosetta]EGD74280.1 hypothetical protein PTSG_12424 [Salpingoeca rosetta]|eukprot:XP_004993180.1 hypothetical protein PTSG_12424 [Salpingoeca rosetta]